MGVEGFVQTPRRFPTSSELTNWAAKEIRYGRLMAQFVRVDLVDEQLSITYKLGNDKEITQKIRYSPIDEAINQKETFLRLVEEAFS